MSIAAPAELTREDRAERLRAMAENVIQDPTEYDAVFADVVRIVAEGLPVARVRETFNDYCDQLDRLEDIDDGNITWDQIAPNLTCSDPDTVVYEMVLQMANDALGTLLDGR